MKEKIILLHTAKLAKYKGFKEKTRFSYKQPIVTPRGTSEKIYREYRIEKTHTQYCSITEVSFSNVEYRAPTQSLLQCWLREKHNINVLVDYDIFAKIGYTYKICGGEYMKEIEIISNDTIPPFLKYEEALEAGLQKAIELI